MGVAFGLVWFMLCDRDKGAGRQRHHSIKARHDCDGVV
jgi:hypothetical protein